MALVVRHNVRCRHDSTRTWHRCPSRSRCHLVLEFGNVAFHIEQHLVQQFTLVHVRVATHVRLRAEQCQLLLLFVGGEVLAQRLGTYLAVLLEYADLLGYVLELPHVSVPIVTLQQVCCLVGELDARHRIFVCEIRCELAEQQRYILFPFAQCGYAYLYGIQSEIQVFAEPSFGYRAFHVEVRGSHHAHGCLLHLGRTHTDELAGLQHTQQSRLGRQG